ncbi:replication initiation and membrane attachment family protein [Chryseomicrobium palamuruense]|uniref:Replication initiation and membrane attachment family protein n=1 Tax=Chryseomicrobium palamuruense TaxID=682973 RepID=A0ABV8UX94_9BACL
MLRNELQPMDAFRTSTAAPVTSQHLQTVTLLYQPLIGAEAFTLYQQLWTMHDDMKEEHAHYALMNALSLPIQRIFEARAHLEAIGLLRTWRKGNDDRTFYYEVQCPLAPHAFFADPLLSIFLWNKVGDHMYQQLEKRFSRDTSWQNNAKELTRSFTDVFQPNLKMAKTTTSKRSSIKTSYDFDYDFDFDLLLEGLNEHLLPRKLLTADVRKMIAKLAFLYAYSPLDMQKIILLAVDDPSTISLERLKKSCEHYFKLKAEQPVAIQSVVTKKQDVVVLESVPEKMPSISKEQELLTYLETSAPVDVLRDVAGGKEPFPADVELVNRFVTVYDMPVGVVNVLIQYVMLRTDMKLTKTFAEKIASHWARKQVKGAKEAMELARKEHEQYMKWKSGETKSSTPVKRQEKVPEWFYKKEQPVVEESPDIEAERQRLLAEISATKGR